MANTRIVTLLKLIRESQLLEQSQLDELEKFVGAQGDAPNLLAREVVKRGWLSRFQIQQIAQGKGKGLILGPYRLLDQLGEGGMGQVFKAHHQPMNRTVALKVIRKEVLANPNSVKRFYREVQAAAKLVHPNIVIAYDAGQVGTTHFFAMEYVEGIDLSRLVKESGPLPVEQSCEYARQAALGLQHAFESGLVHRDIKPANLLLSRTTADKTASTKAAALPVKPEKVVVKILDMGLARLQGPAEEDNALTKEGTVVGTPDFLAPEQAMSASKADIRSDLYSLGCTLYFLLAGRAPFRAGSLTEILLKHQTEEPPPIEEFRQGVPAGVRAVLRRMLAKKPEDRYQTPAEMARALEPFCKGGNATAALPDAAYGLRHEDDVDEPAEERKKGASSALEDSAADESSATIDGDRRPTLSRRGARTTVASRHKTNPWKYLAIGVGLSTAVAALVFVLMVKPFDRPGKRDDKDSSALVDPGLANGSAPNPPSPTRPVFPPPPGRGPDLPPAKDELSRVAVNVGGLFSAALAADGKRVLAFGTQGLNLWEIASGKDFKALSFRGPGGPVLAGALSPDGRTVLTVSPQETSIRVWDVDSGKDLMRLSGHTQAVRCLAFSADGRNIVSGGGMTGAGAGQGQDYALRIWDRASGAALAKLEGHRQPIEQAVFSPDGRRVLSSSGADIALWDLGTGKVLRWLTGHAQPVTCLAFAPDGFFALSGSSDRLKLWELETGKEARSFQGNQGGVLGVAFAPDGRRALSGGGELRRQEDRLVPSNCTLHLWDVGSGSELQRFDGHVDVVRSVFFTPDGQRLLSASRDGTLRLWQPSPPGKPPDSIPTPPGSGDEILRFQGLQAAVHSLALAEDGRRVLAGAQDGSVLLWNIENASAPSRFHGHTTAILKVALTRDGVKALSASGAMRNMEAVDCSVRVWDTGARKELRRLNGFGGPVTAVLLSADGLRVVTYSNDRMVRLWEVETGRELRAFPPLTQPALGMSLSPDGRRLLFGQASQLVLWDLESGKEILRLDHPPYIFSTAFSPDGRRALSGGGSFGAASALNSTIRLWDLDQGKELATLEGHSAPVLSLAFSRNGLCALSGSGGFEIKDKQRVPVDCTVRLWDLAAGKELSCLKGHTERVTSVALTPDGQAVSGSWDRTIRLWKLPALELLTRKPPDTNIPIAKLPIPEADAQARAEKEIRELFKEGYAKRGPAEMKELAAKLFEQGINTKDKPVERFVLLREAGDLAAQAGNPALTFKAVDALALTYAVDPVDTKIKALEAAAKPGITLPVYRGLIDSLLTLEAGAVAQDNYDLAARLVTSAESIARKSNNTDLTGRVEARGKQLHELQKEFIPIKALAETLKQKPSDPEANLAVGKFVCLIKGDWSRGLPLLALGGNEDYKTLAKKDLSRPTAAADQVELGETYWKLAETEKGTARTRLLRRAYLWFDEASPGLKGIEQTKAEKKIKQILELVPDLRKTEGPIRVFEGHTGEVRAVAFSPDSRRALSGGADKTVRLWDVSTGKEVFRFPGTESEIASLAFSPDGKRAAFGYARGVLQIVDIDRRQILHMDQRGADAVSGIGFSPDSRRVFGVSDRSFFQSAPREQLPGRGFGKGMGDLLSCMALAGDGQLALIGTSEGPLWVYDPINNKVVRSLNNNGKANCLALSTDGRLAVSASVADKAIRTWDVTSGKEMPPFKGHVGQILSLAVSRDGTRLLSGGADKSVRLWDVKSRKEIARFDGHAGSVGSVALSPDGRRALSAGADKTVRLWALPR